MKRKSRTFFIGFLYIVALFSFLGAVTANSRGSMLMNDVKVVWDQPKHGAGPGADDLSEPRKNQQQNQIV